MNITERTTLSQIVAHRIKSYIVENKLIAGDKLPSEKQLIAALSVSRTVIREALKSLEVVEIVKIKPGDGIYVNNPSLKPVMDQVSFQWMQSTKNMKELLATRSVLELSAIDMAVEHYDIQQINQMEFWIQKMHSTIEFGEMPIEEDFQFHRALFKATGNEVYFELSEVLSEFFIRIRELHFGDLQKSRTSLEEHREIVKFIRLKDAAKARSVMIRHLETLEMYT